MSDEQKQRVEIMMRDYEAHKTYSTSVSPGIRYNLVSMALATIGIVISATVVAVASREIGDLAAIVVAGLWLILVPSICMVLMLAWLGEEQRAVRSSEYNRELEKRINKELGLEALNWEAFKRRESIMYPEIMIMALFFGLSLISSLAGLYLMEDHFHLVVGWVAVVDLVIHAALALDMVVFVRRFVLGIRNAKTLDDFTTTGSTSTSKRS